MNYVCTVVGKLVFEDINLELNYMEIIALSPNDFKASPRIRDAYQRKQIVPYDARIHPNAKFFNRFTKDTKLTSQYAAVETPEPKKQDVRFSEVTELKANLESISDKMSNLVNRLNIFINQQIETNEKLNQNFEKFFQTNPLHNDKFHEFLNKSMEHHSRVEAIWEQKLNDKDDKIDKLISKLEEFIDKGVKVHGATSYNSNTSTKVDGFDDNVKFIPELDLKGVKASIKTQEIKQDNTDDILAKLRAMKNNS